MLNKSIDMTLISILFRIYNYASVVYKVYKYKNKYDLFIQLNINIF